GQIIPTIYFKHLLNGMFNVQPFSFVTNQMLEIILNNYILDTPITFYMSFVITAIILLVIIVWRYRR
ncbi:MAG: ABC transporter permease, partial [Staphylococcus saprophyticus]